MPPGRPQRRGMLRPAPAPLGGGTDSTGVQAAIALAVLRGCSLCPPLHPPANNDLGGQAGNELFTVRTKNRALLLVVVADLRLAGAPTCSQGAPRPGAAGALGRHLPKRSAGHQNADPTRLVRTGRTDSESQFKRRGKKS